MRAEAERVYVVDDDEAVRQSLGMLLGAAGYEVRCYACGDTFLSAAADAPFGCAVLDMRMPGRDGLQVQRALTRRHAAFPVVMLTAHGDVAAAVQAMKEGASDFIEKPCTGDEILRAVASAIEHGRAVQEHAAAVESAAGRLAALSLREAEVLEGLVAGRQNKVIAYDLGISPRTVEIHRSNLMAKLGVRSLPEVVRLVHVARATGPAGVVSHRVV